MRPLREANILSHGPRGISVPYADVIEVCYMVFAMVSRRPTNSGETARRTADLQLVAPPGLSDWNGIDLQGKWPLLVLLSTLIKRPILGDYRRLEVAEDGRRAWLTVEHGSAGTIDLLFVCPTRYEKMVRHIGAELETYKNQGAAYCGHRFVIGAGAIGQIGIKFEEAQRKEADQQR